MMKTVVIVIPVYNEAKVIGSVIEEVRAHGYEHIVVVDDGSADDSYLIATAYDVLALRLKINRGKGAAVKTGIMAANLLGADVVV
ncbi:glycosyltransferase, partial [Desulfobulbus sp. F3]|nr:glycosyltransferase [Desulfobulbus sp. F3]